jgi:hypothetical protein
VGFLSDHCRRIEVDYQSGSEQPHSKGSADLFIYQATLMRRGAWMKSGFGFMIRGQEVVQCE